MSTQVSLVALGLLALSQFRPLHAQATETLWVTSSLSSLLYTMNANRPGRGG